MFCFTNARGTSYKPGETLPALRELLKENKNADMSLSKNNIYCMDNEAFRFLCAKRRGISFDDESDSSQSWKKSADGINRMLEHIEKLTPHQMKDTLSLNASRKLIVDMTKPLADIAQLIQTNIAVVKDKENEINTCDAKKKELEEKLNIVAVENGQNRSGFP